MDIRKSPYLKLFCLIACIVVAMSCFGLDISTQPLTADADTHQDAVILLHGLGRGKRSMHWIERSLRQNGFAVYNLGYPSLDWSIEETSERSLARTVETCRSKGFQRIHFVTHSMGAVVVRYYLQHHSLPDGSRIVMLAPPNSGSEVMDWALVNIGLFDRLAGPAAAELHTGSDALHARLTPVEPEVGVLIGHRSWNPFFSSILPGEDDGKVSVQRARLPEMQDFMVVPANHTTILLDPRVRSQILHFLQKGRFCHGKINIKH